MPNLKLPTNKNLENYFRTANSINAILDTLWWISPLINPDCGKIEPHEQYLVDGLLAFSDGTNWDAGSGKGFYYYDLGTTSWVKIG